MKVLYLIFGGQEHGVRKKILDKALSIRKAGIDMSIIFLVDKMDWDDNTKSELYDLVGIDYSESTRCSRIPIFWRFSILLRQRAAYLTLSAYLRQNRFDLVLMRYPISDFFLLQFMKRHSRYCRIVFEHNTVETSELRLRSNNSFWYKYFYWSEKWFARRVRERASGLISVTREIERWQSHLANGKAPLVTISNGIDVSRIKLKTNGLGAEHSPVNLLFLAGSEAPWHGVDILFNSLRAYGNPNAVHCFVAGRIDPASAASAMRMNNVTLLDHQSHEALDELIEKCHIGIGSLALFRNNMAEGCTLKVREYWARGLPFVIGYDDTDLMENREMEPYFLKVDILDGKHGPGFDMNLVVSFARSVLKIPDVHASMRALAIKTIDYKIKANSYLTFFKKVMGTTRSDVAAGGRYETR